MSIACTARGGSWVIGLMGTAFTDSIETQALMTYISGGEWVNEKGKAFVLGLNNDKAPELLAS